MSETPQELIARLRAGDHTGELTTLGGAVHDVKCLDAADWIDASLAREAVLRDALADAEANMNIKDSFLVSAINLHAADSQRILELEEALTTK